MILAIAVAIAAAQAPAAQCPNLVTPQAFTCRALQASNAGNPEAARTISGDPFLWYFSAALAIREGDAVTAKAAIGQALTLEPNDPTVLFEAGHVYHFAGDMAAARSYWTRASAADPRGKSGQAAREALAMLDKPVVQSEAPATK